MVNTIVTRGKKNEEVRTTQLIQDPGHFPIHQKRKRKVGRGCRQGKKNQIGFISACAKVPSKTSGGGDGGGN